MENQPIMGALNKLLPWRQPTSRIPNKEPALRGELLSVDLLKQYAHNVAQNRRVKTGNGSNLLLPRLTSNEKILSDYNKETLQVEKKRRITPAAEWLLDNFHLIEEQIRTAQRHLPQSFSRELPRLLNGPWANYPRTYEIAVEVVSHTDGRVDNAHLNSFIAGYQEVVSLTLGELWSIPIMLRLALIENLRRVTVQLNAVRHDRDKAEEWAEKILEVAGKRASDLIITLGEMAQSRPTLNQAFVTEFMRRIQEKAPAVKLVVGWIEERLAEEGVTVQQLIQNESQHQAEAQVSVGNSIGSLRFLDSMDWRGFVEAQSTVEQTLRADPAQIYAQMDFTTRDHYRHAVERIARHSRKSEFEVASLAIDLARKQPAPSGAPAHVGFFLTSHGLKTLEKQSGIRPPVRDRLGGIARKFPLTFYLGAIFLIAAVTTGLFVQAAITLGLARWLLTVTALLAFVSSSQLAVSLVNWLITILVSPSSLPRMDFSKGIPPEQATMVVVPTLLSSTGAVDSMLEGLEVRYLANNDKNVFFALLTDFRDASAEHQPGDEELVQQASTGIDALNRKYGKDRPCIFYFFHRPRLWNQQEQVWMGYERKRGKLAALNRFLLDGSKTGFSRITGDLAALPRIKYVITLDLDTNLPRDAARLLTAAMAHPMNRPIYDAAKGLITGGHAILQPRVAVSLPGANGSLYVKLFSGELGIDPYTRAVSDVYQDAFQEGSFIGKGIYEVEAFERAIAGKFPENRILSHDLLEGCYARSALVSDVQLFEGAPARYNVEMRRRHRWMRGDWQIAEWVLPRIFTPAGQVIENPLSGLSRWKIFDNLRRSLVPGAVLFLILLGWLVFPSGADRWLFSILALIAIPFLLSALAEFSNKPKDLPHHLHLKSVGKIFGRQTAQILVALAFLPYEAIVSLDAVIRTLWRLVFSRRRLLEWQTSHEIESSDPGSFGRFFAGMGSAIVLTVGILVLFLLAGIRPSFMTWTVLALWAGSPAIAWWISLPIKGKATDLSPAEVVELRKLARKTWDFFETFVTEREHWLPPDNFQEYPNPVIATRTSPTNLGLYLLGVLGAYDFGYVSLPGLIERVGRSIKTVGELERHRDHFYNWYDTRTLKPMQPLYVSTVDNGNLAALLLTLHSGLVELTDIVGDPDRIIGGLRDTLLVLEDQSPAPAVKVKLTGLENILNQSHRSRFELLQIIGQVLEAIAPITALKTESTDEFNAWLKILEDNCNELRSELLAAFPWLQLQPHFEDLFRGRPAHEVKKFWDELNKPVSLRDRLHTYDKELAKLDAMLGTVSNDLPIANVLAELRPFLEASARHAQSTVDQLEELARQADQLARMDFGLLYNSARELFSIGYNVSQHRLDNNCYDLLASESRLGSYVAVALGQVDQSHWFRLGRSLTSAGGKPTLISWSGSMFEYLMPMLVMPSYENTLLDLSCKSAVARQIQYGRQVQTPWGISESGYNFRDADGNYQYHAFGVPGLGYKRGLAHDLVIAPYATVMALMVAPMRSYENLKALGDEKANGRYGLYEALDYTVSRVPTGQTHAIVRSFMAHHQGMSFLSLVYALLGRPMQRRFEASPLLKSSELLLQERVPRETAVLYPHELEANRQRELPAATEATLRVFTDPSSGPPEVHLLSNGRYHVMVTSAGGGYSQWNDTAMTRWREDSTRDCWGTFFYLRDISDGIFWSPTYQPTLEAGPGYEAIFSQGRAEFRANKHEIESHAEIAISPENDVEVRRITLTNHSPETRSIEITSYAEVVLNSYLTDLTHPAFSNLFIQTHIIQNQNAILCSRRPRAEHDKPPWSFYVLLVHGTEVGKTTFETDRSKFIGRGGNTSAPAALKNSSPLSNSEGSVLDPIASIRRTVELEHKQSATVTLVSGIAPTREEVMALVEKYQDQTIADRCFELAWTNGLMMLRHLNTTEAEAQHYGRLASAMLYNNPLRRAPGSVIERNKRGQQNLWSFGISGDLPILLLYVTNVERPDLLRQIVQAHAYWRLKGLKVDLVILNEDDSVYRQALHDQVLNIVAANNATQLIDKPGGIFLRRLDQLSPDDKVLLETAARAVLHDNQGALADQLANQPRPAPLPPPLRIRTRAEMETPAEISVPDLVFFNGLGGFTRDGREYVIQLKAGATTPAPWVNVIANPNFGTVISETGGSYTWSENSHEFRLTPWNNDAVGDSSGEAFYLRDEESGHLWSPTPLPARGEAPYLVRHGFGYSVFSHTEDGIYSELSIYVSVHEPVKFAVFKIRNESTRRRQLSLTGYWEWVLGELRGKNAMHVVTEIDQLTGALFARNAYNADFEGRVAFVASTEPGRSYTADRTEFFGRNGTPARPAALRRTRLSGKIGAGLDPCAAIQVQMELEPGEEHETAFILGAGKNLQAGQDLVRRFRSLSACARELKGVGEFWGQTLGAVQVETPEPALNLLANGWLIYQTLSCRLWARTGFYQSGGAFGFRDQLQDAMTFVHTRRELLREQLLRVAAHQFREGDVQHWWHPPTGRGVRTHFSDDYLWLPYATCRYVEAVGDTGVLDSQVPFLESRLLRPEEEANYELPQRSNESATLYEHCVRAVKNGLKFGEHGLPLMGCGDWNDGMNLIGEKGKGESVWLAFFLYDVLKKFSVLATRRGDTEFAKNCDEQAITLRENIEKNAWDGEWYRRAYFDNGDPVGSASNPECQIDSLPQSWGVISGAAPIDRTRPALAAVFQRLVRQDAGLIQLFDPPFDKSAMNPGYIKGYLPGVRENGGQYTHAAIWTVMAFALSGDSARAWKLFQMINPILHAQEPGTVARYKGEPYVVAADIYSMPPHVGRCGWTWYTGSAGWMYRLIMETLLGVEILVSELRFTPRVPVEWKSFKVHYRYRETVFHITCVNTSGTWKVPAQIWIEGALQDGSALKLVDDRLEHHVEARF